jgi:hypothetical protein
MSTEKAIVVTVEESDRNHVESMDYECAARRDAVTFMLANNMDITTEAFKAYQKEMTEFNTKFSKAKSEIEKKYVFPVTDGKKVRWTLDYQSCQLTITFIND